MILSHKHRFIFVKGQKVAGTSIEIALSQICGPDDVITPITPIDERLRIAGGGGARNYSDDRDEERRFVDAVAAAPSDEQIDVQLPHDNVFKNHMSLRRIRRKAPEAASYRIVFAERSPYAKVLSMANWRRSLNRYTKGGGLKATTDGLVDKIDAAIENGSILQSRNIPLYREEDGSIPAKGWRHETLNDDLAAFFTELGVAPVAMPNAKAGLRMGPEEVRDVLRPDQIAYINEAFADEFEAFGYERF